MKFNKFLFLALFAGLFAACTDLEENLDDSLTFEQAGEFVDVTALLDGAYAGMRLPFQDQSNFWAAQQHTSDETMGPTRGPDWDDNGIWRTLHNHTWDAEHAFLQGTFNNLLQVVFQTTNLLQFEPSPEQEAEARFLRAFVVFCVADGWGQVPIREAGENLLVAPRVMSATEAIDYVISECNAIMSNLPAGAANRANKDAAKVLLMKAHLSKGVFADRENPKFDAADMTGVISLAEELSASYSLSDNYFDNFAPDNDTKSSENIWTYENIAGVGGSGNSVRARWFCGLHYNQNPSGWNGFTTLSDFYDSFEAGDVRAYNEYDGSFDVGGINNGFLVGQQTDAAGNELDDRKGNKMAFTPEVAIVETGNNLEITGIRVNKYVIDYNNGDDVDNDYVFFRFADVHLMKAEAKMRSGDMAGAMADVNILRDKRGASALTTMTADDLLAERGRELYWEGWRRQDQIRFGKFLDAWQEKPASGSERLLFPIPGAALAVNPNLSQNPGY